jgi:hypothetical protein
MKALSLKRDKLRSWMREGFIKPKYPAEGQGSKAIFTRWDVYGVALFKDLINHGYKRKAIAKYVHDFVSREEKTQNPAVEFIVFRHEVVKGKTQVNSMAITKLKPKDKSFWVMEIRTGLLGTYNEEHKWLSISPDLRQINDVNFDSEDWDHIHLVNFKKLKNNIDSALSGL